MSDSPINKRYSVAGFEDAIQSLVEEVNTPQVGGKSEETVEISLESSKAAIARMAEDSSRLSQGVLHGRTLHLKEKWDITKSIQGKVVHVTPSKVFVDCLIEIDSRTIKHRSFPSYLFDNIENIQEGMPVVIKTQIKKGASRIDVFSGSGIVNLSLFDSRAEWNQLDNNDLGDRLTEW
jgi:hypothetical protein